MTITRIIPIPDTRVRGFTICDVNGDFNIYINANASDAMQRQAYDHEIRHIRRGDFDSGMTADEIEREVHDGQTAQGIRPPD